MDTLVLSATYEPLRRVSWKQAMKLWITGRAEVLEEYADRVVRTVSVVFRMPAVIRFLRTFRRRPPAVKFSKENVYARDKGRCQYCGCDVPRAAVTFDHVVPRSLGGRTTWENLVVACRRCNQVKANRTPEQACMMLRTRPQRPRYLPSFFQAAFAFESGMPDEWRLYLAEDG